jgi:hypothetical protein
MTVLIPSEEGFKCGNCDFKTDDIFMFLEHCDVSFSWGLRLSNRYSIDLFPLLEQISKQIQHGHLECADALVQSLVLSLVNASEGEQSFHKFINEAKTMEMTKETIDSIEEMLKKYGKSDENK